MEHCQVDSKHATITVTAVFDHTVNTHALKLEVYSEQTAGAGAPDEMDGYNLSVMLTHQSAALTAL